MRSFKHFLNGFEVTAMAAAFAEGGDFESARQVLRGKDRVLLVMAGQKNDREAFQYAASFCSRMDADLEILCTPASRSEVAGLTGEITRLGISFRVHERRGCLKDAVTEISRAIRSINYVVMPSRTVMQRDCEQGSALSPKDLQHMPLPLVVVGA